MLTLPRVPLLAKVLLGVVLAFVAMSVGCSALHTQHYRSALPAEIETTFGLATTGSSSSILDLFAGGRMEACGGAIFKLSDKTISAVRDGGLTFLKDARQGRGYTDAADRLFHYYSYAPWQPTPLPPKWTSEGAWYGLSCMYLGPEVRSILDAARAPGSFYTTGRSKMLWIAPGLGLAVFTFTS